MKARGENQRGQGQTQIEHEWNDVNNGDDRDRPQMADDDDNDSKALTGGDITRYRALVARISYLLQDRPALKFASMQVCCAMAKPTTRDMERVKRIGRYLVGKPRARCWPTTRDMERVKRIGRYLVGKPRARCSVGSRVVSWRRTRTLTGAATEPLEDLCRLGSS